MSGYVSGDTYLLLFLKLAFPFYRLTLNIILAEFGTESFSLHVHYRTEPAIIFDSDDNSQCVAVGVHVCCYDVLLLQGIVPSTTKGQVTDKAYY